MPCANQFIFILRIENCNSKLSVSGVILSIGFLFPEYYVVEIHSRHENSILSGSYQIGALLPVLMVVIFLSGRTWNLQR